MYESLPRYLFLKCLQLEGRFPNDVGGWILTVRRFAFGWGEPRPEDVPPIEFHENRPLPEPPYIAREKSKPFRSAYYQRVRNSSDCQRIFRTPMVAPVVVPAVSASFEIGAEWANPPGGILPSPGEAAPPCESHAVPILGVDVDTKMFLFQNSWGDWGDAGWGQMPFSYFDQRLIEAWATGADPDHQGSLKRFAQGERTQTIQWEARSIWREPLYTFVIYDPLADERIAWTFVLMRNESLDVEDLYVRPEYRGQGYGRELVDTIRVFSRGKNRPLRLFVPFVDSKQESPGNINALVSVVRRLGLKFRKCDVRWAAYLAVSGGESDVPIEPDHFPTRAMSTLEKVRAAALALVVAAGGDGGGDATPGPTRPESMANVSDPEGSGQRSDGIPGETNKGEITGNGSSEPNEIEASSTMVRLAPVSTRARA